MKEAPPRPSTIPITEIMTKTVVTLTPSVSLDVVARIFIEDGMSGAPIVDENGRPIGVVTKTDLLQVAMHDGAEAVVHSQRTSEGLELEFGPGFRPDHLRSKTVGDVMTPMAYALPDTASVAQAAALMAYEGIHRVVITAKDDTVAGLVTTIDILRWLARADGYVVPDTTQLRRLGGLS